MERISWNNLTGLSVLSAADLRKQFMAVQPQSIPVDGKLLREVSNGEINYALQFDWNGQPQSFKLHFGSVEDKWLKYEDGKLNTTIGTEVAEGSEVIDTFKLLPSRLRPDNSGNRYYEFYLTFDRNKDKNGLWGISEEAARNYPAPFFFFRLEDGQPFWLREGHKDEKRIMPRWQKPTLAEIRAFTQKKAGA